MTAKRLFSLLVVLVLATLSITPRLFAQDDMTPTVQWTTATVRTHPSQGDVLEIEDGRAQLFTS